MNVKKKVKKILVSMGVLSLFFRIKILLSKVEFKGNRSFLAVKTSVNSLGKNNTILIGKDADIRNCSIKFNGSNNTLNIKENTKLRNLSLVFEENTNFVSIGFNTEIYGPSLIAAMESTKVIIGNDCLFSSGLIIRTGDSHSLTNLNGERINKSNSIEIGNKVWIGSDVKILKGVKIANENVIATGSILNHKFLKENTIIGGITAKVKKENIKWLKERIKIY